MANQQQSDEAWAAYIRSLKLAGDPRVHWERYRGEDGLVYAYPSWYDGDWLCWDGPGAIWRPVPGGPPCPVYRLYGDEESAVMDAFDVDFQRRKRAERDGDELA